MDNASWGALALALAVLAGIWTWWSFRRGRVAAGVRGVGLTLLPIAAYLTHTLRMLGRVASAIGDWAAGFVFSPTVWLGLIVGAVSVVLILLSFRLSGGSRQRVRSETDAVEPRRRTTQGGADLGLGDEFDDIQAILRKRGIS